MKPIGTHPDLHSLEFFCEPISKRLIPLFNVHPAKPWAKSWDLFRLVPLHSTSAV